MQYQKLFTTSLKFKLSFDGLIRWVMYIENKSVDFFENNIFFLEIWALYIKYTNIFVKLEVASAITLARQVAIALCDKLKAKLDRRSTLYVIGLVTEPTRVRLLVTVKILNGILRFIPYQKDLNKAIKRQHYQLHTEEELFSTWVIPNISLSLTPGTDIVNIYNNFWTILF